MSGILLEDILYAEENANKKREESRELNKKWGLACQGGAFKGAWEAGFLSVIAECKRFDFITFAGTSVGALNSALMILARNDNSIFENIWSKITSPLSIWSFDFILRKSSQKKLERFIPKELIDRISKKIKRNDLVLTIITTQETNKTWVEYPFIFQKKGNRKTAQDDHSLIKDALLASTSLPYLYPKKEIIRKGKKEFFLDGGLVNNNPIQHLNGTGLKNILVLIPQYNLKKDKANNKRISMFIKTLLLNIPIIWRAVYVYVLSTFVDSQTIRKIQKVYSDKQNLKDTTDSVIWNSPQFVKNKNIYICFPSKKLRADGYFFVNNRKIMNDFNLGKKDAKVFINKLAKSEAISYTIEQTKLRTPIKTPLDKKLGKTFHTLY